MPKKFMFVMRKPNYKQMEIKIVNGENDVCSPVQVIVGGGGTKHQ